MSRCIHCSLIFFAYFSFILLSFLYTFFFFFFNDTATTEIYTLSLHDALPILLPAAVGYLVLARPIIALVIGHGAAVRSEEHTSELQSRLHLVCRLLLEKKKKKTRLSTINKKSISRKIKSMRKWQ